MASFLISINGRQVQDRNLKGTALQWNQITKTLSSVKYLPQFQADWIKKIWRKNGGYLKRLRFWPF